MTRRRWQRRKLPLGKLERKLKTNTDLSGDRALEQEEQEPKELKEVDRKISGRSANYIC